MDLGMCSAPWLARPGRLPGVPDSSTDHVLSDAPKLPQVDPVPLFLAATRVIARRRRDVLVVQLRNDPFVPAACRGTGCYVVGPGVLALAAYRVG